MKYDLSQIMKDAWEISRKAKCVLSEALKMAWNLAKALLDVRKEDCREEEGSISINFWFNYGKARAYFKRSWTSSFQNGKGYYINLETGTKRMN